MAEVQKIVYQSHRSHPVIQRLKCVYRRKERRLQEYLLKLKRTTTKKGISEGGR